MYERTPRQVHKGLRNPPQSVWLDKGLGTMYSLTSSTNVTTRALEMVDSVSGDDPISTYDSQNTPGQGGGGVGHGAKEGWGPLPHGRAKSYPPRVRPARKAAFSGKVGDSPPPWA